MTKKYLCKYALYGEIAHITEGWIDFKNRMTKIPEHENRTKSKDGGSCGYCRSLAKSVVKHSTPSIEEAKLTLLEEGLLLNSMLGVSRCTPSSFLSFR